MGGKQGHTRQEPDLRRSVDFTGSRGPRVGDALKAVIQYLLLPYEKIPFLQRMSPGFSILDVGCGNNSPFLVKSVLPSCIYTGLDIGDYNQTMPLLADNYILTTPDNFSAEIGKFKECFDVVMSNHNLEHCDDRKKTLEAMVGAVKVGGYLYLRIPSEWSVSLPSRGGTLNYFDDPTHKDLPPRYDDLVATVRAYGFDLIHAKRRYRPWVNVVRGFLNERKSRRLNMIIGGTWAYHGFESIVLARKVTSSVKAE